MRNWKKLIVLLLVMAAWLILMWRLSSADGTETLKESMNLARKVAALLFDSPTDAQLEYLNLLLRKMAHIFLYAVLGLMSGMFWHLLLEHCHIWLRAIPAMLCCTVIAFLDELQKIPIAGRHFSCSESILNAISAAFLILFYFILIHLLSQRKNHRSYSK